MIVYRYFIVGLLFVYCLLVIAVHSDRVYTLQELQAKIPPQVIGPACTLKEQSDKSLCIQRNRPVPIRMYKVPSAKKVKILREPTWSLDLSDETCPMATRLWNQTMSAASKNPKSKKQETECTYNDLLQKPLMKVVHCPKYIRPIPWRILTLPIQCTLLCLSSEY